MFKKLLIGLGSRFFPWLPNFSLELTRGEVMQTNQLENNSVDAMARQVQALFPQYPLSDIIEDLRITHSMEWTIDGILDGRLSLGSSPMNDISLDTVSVDSDESLWNSQALPSSSNSSFPFADNIK